MDNTVGSLEVPMLLHARRNLILSMTQRQKDILIGCVLGDAYVAPRGKIRIEQSTKQREYLLWKHKELCSLAYPSLPAEAHRTRHQSGRTYSSVYFELRQYFRPWRAIFYQETGKTFPRNLVLSPLSLAVWYMDDGCWTGEKLIIATEGFSDKDRDAIQTMFWKQFGIETIVGKNRKLVIRKQSHTTFCSLISPHIITSMKYKLP